MAVVCSNWKRGRWPAHQLMAFVMIAGPQILTAVFLGVLILAMPGSSLAGAR